MTYRLCYRVTGHMAFLSHLEILRLWQRTLLRSGLPIRWSEGFNPRPKISAGPARGVGIIGEEEYLDLELISYCAGDILAAAIKRALPADVLLLRWRELPEGSKTLEAVINEIDYKFYFLRGAPANLSQRVEAFMAADRYLYLRKSPKGDKEIDLRVFVRDLLLTGDVLSLTVNTGPRGSLRPLELLTALTDWDIIGDVEIHRCGLYVRTNGQRVRP